MVKTFKILILVCIGLFSSHLLAKTLNLNPNESRVLKNNTLWAINATCNIHTPDQNKILIQVMKNQGSINGQHLSQGQSKTMTLANNSSISVGAAPGTQINLTNMGTDHLQAVCST